MLHTSYAMCYLEKLWYYHWSWKPQIFTRYPAYVTDFHTNRSLLLPAFSNDCV